MARYDADGKILYFNKLLLKALEVKNEDIIGKLSTQYWPDGRYKEYEEKLLDCIKTGERKTLNLDATSPENKKTHHVIHFYPERNKHGKVIGAISYCIDITEKVLLEKQVEIDSRLSMIGQLFSNVAHEVSNPLMTISMKCELMEERLEKHGFNKKEFSQFVTDIKHHISRINQTIKSTRTAVRNTDRDLFQMDNIEDIIKEALSVCDSKIQLSNIKILRESDFTKPIELYCRKIQIEQVLINLISNACDSIRNQERPWIEIETYQNEENIIISIKDSGAGISPEAQELMKGPFYTSKPPGEGTGLGLYISRKIIQEHHGEIYIDNDCTNTKFILKFPKGT